MKIPLIKTIKYIAYILLSSYINNILEFGHIGTVDNKPVLRFRKPTIRKYYGLGNIENLKVDIVPSYPGADSTCN